MSLSLRHILGISAFYHDSAAVLLRDGMIVAAAQEERFSRKKNDERFPAHAVDFCLRQANIPADALDAVVFYDKPITKFARLLESYLAVAPFGLATFPKVMPAWLSEKLNLRKTIRDEIPGMSATCPVLFTEHHQAHAASAFHPSPFKEAAIITVDGVGEWATTTLGIGRGTHIDLLKEIRFPHSLGLLYSAFTAYCGFRINSGEYKLMGLAPYGEPRYARKIHDHLIDIKPDGSFWLNLEYFHFLRGLTMTNERFHQLFDGPPRKPESKIEERHMHIARSIQVVTEDVMLRLAKHARELTGLPNLCLAGGVALNCVANGRILRSGIFDRIWIQPAAGDAGGALGAALAVWHGQANGHSSPLPHHKQSGQQDGMSHALLGPEFSDGEIEVALKRFNAVYERLDEESLLNRTVDLLRNEKVVAWVQGRMEFGPRALGNRSILGDPRSPRMQSMMNLKVKFRESFRPFAPIVRREKVAEYFDLDADSPYMLLVSSIKEALRNPPPKGITGLELLKHPRSTIPAVTHVDYSARIQTVSRDQNPLLYALLQRFEDATGCGVLVNTSFNIRGEPIICTPDDAYRCLINTEMDYLVMGHFLIERAAQPHKQLARTHDPQPD